MLREDFNKHVDEMVRLVHDRLTRKDKEYSVGTDRLSAFAKAAVLQDAPMETALMGMATKHFVSIIEMCQPDNRLYTESQWEEKIGDSIAYLLILWAMVHRDE